MIDEYVVGRPTGAAARWVHAYHGYRQFGVPPTLHLGLPSPYLTVIFTLDEPLRLLQHVDPTRPPGTYTAMVGGLHTSPAIITHDGAQSGVQVMLDPLGCRSVLGLPAAELAGIDVDAADVLGAAAGRILDQLHAAPSWAARFAVLDTFLGGCVVARDPISPVVAGAWEGLRRSGGSLPVQRLALDSGCSQRYLAKMFQSELGLTPKVAGRVVRFDLARRRLLRGGGTVARTAAAAGYYDQAHLDRDFRQFAGCSPTQWLALEFRNVQDDTATPVPG